MLELKGRCEAGLMENGGFHPVVELKECIFLNSPCSTMFHPVVELKEVMQ